MVVLEPIYIDNGLKLVVFGCGVARAGRLRKIVFEYGGVGGARRAIYLFEISEVVLFKNIRFSLSRGSLLNIFEAIL